MHKLMTFLGTLALGALVAMSATANPGEQVTPYQPLAGVSPVPIEADAGLRSRQDLETFLDGVMADQLDSHGLAGATVAVVKDGALFFAKGYGYADLEKRIPMDAESSLIRPGSVSKLFAWTAVMQLVERGLVDLDADVNLYLKRFQIPDTFDQPITVRNILTHTAGLEDGALGYLMVDSPEGIEEMAGYIAKHMPERVRPPTTDFNDGSNASYSNWATALGGVIVEDVTGIGFDDYIEQEIFKPLGMNHSTFAEPLPERLQPQMAKGYKHEAGDYTEVPFELIHNFGPAGSLTSSATDMAKFMIAHLQDGRYGDQRILKEETARLMHSRQFSPAPHVNGSGLGFYESFVNGRRLIGHGGDTNAFHSDLNLFKEQGIGIFISYNSGPLWPIRGRNVLLQAFMDRYFPAHLPQIEPPEDFLERAGDYAGSYLYNRMSFTKNERLFYSLSPIKVAPYTNNTLVMSNMMGPGASQWVEVKKDTFRRSNSADVITFFRNEAGEVTGFSLPLAFIAAYKLSWFELVELHGLILALAVLATIGAIVGAWRNRREPLDGARRARWLAATTGAVFSAALVLLVVAMIAVSQDAIAGFPDYFDVVLALILLALLLSIIVVLCAVQSWRAGWFSRWGRIRYSLTAVAFVAFLWVLNFYNLVGYHYG